VARRVSARRHLCDLLSACVVAGRDRRLPRLTIALGIAGLVAFAVVWMQLLAEFPKK
jgi:hypothetical protein